MRLFQFVFVFSLSLIFLSLSGQKECVKNISVQRKKKIKIPEPSDLTFFNNQWMVVSDNGFLYSCTLDFSSCSKTGVTGADFEALATNGDFLWVSEESLRNIRVYNKKLEKVKNLLIHENGPLNAGFEALAYDSVRSVLIAITESPPLLLEINDDVPSGVRYPLSVRGDISAATVYNGFLWLLSDERRLIYKYSLPDYKILQIYSIPVVNPEGIAFDTDGKLLILSDDRQTIYYFDLSSPHD